MGQFSVKTYNPPGSLLSATQQLNIKLAAEARKVSDQIVVDLLPRRNIAHDESL